MDKLEPCLHQTMSDNCINYHHHTNYFDCHETMKYKKQCPDAKPIRANTE